MALVTHNVPLYFLKNCFGEVDEAMFEGVKRPYEFIFCIVSNEKSDLREIACDVLRTLTASRTHNFRSESFKIRLW
jgi:hypothetical protein